MNWKLKYGIVGIVVGIILLVMSASDTIGFLKTPIVPRTPEDVRNLKPGDHVNLDITMICDGIISETTTTKKNGTVTDKKESARYYVVPFWTEDDTYYLTVKVKPDDFDAAEQAWDAFDKWFFEADDEGDLSNVPEKVTLSIDGLVKAMNDDEKQRATDYTGYMDMQYININNKSASYIICIIGFVFIVVSAVILVLFFIGKKKEKARLEEMRSSNPGYYQAPEGVTFNNDAAPKDPYAFDPSTDPRFNGKAFGNPNGYSDQTGSYNISEQNINNNTGSAENYGANADNDTSNTIQTNFTNDTNNNTL